MPTTIIPHNNIRSNKRYIIPKGQSKMNNAEKRATQGTQGEETQNKNTAKYVLDTTIRKQTQTILIRRA